MSGGGGALNGIIVHGKRQGRLPAALRTGGTSQSFSAFGRNLMSFFFGKATHFCRVRLDFERELFI